MRGRNLLGLSNANRRAAGVQTGEEVEVDVELDAEPRVLVEPADFARALDAAVFPPSPTRVSTKASRTGVASADPIAASCLVLPPGELLRDRRRSGESS
jgi:hypothetical protein